MDDLLTDWFWPLVAGACGIMLLGALAGAALDAVSGTRLNVYLRRRGAPPVGNGVLDTFDDCRILCRVADHGARLLLLALLTWHVVRGGLAPSEALGVFLGAGAAGWILLHVLPAAVAHVAAEKLVGRAMGGARVAGRLFGPFARLHEGLVTFLVRVLGGDVERRTEQAVEEEILSAAEEGEREGLIARGGKDMIESIISFYDAEVQGVMTPRTSMVCLPAGMQLAEAVQVATRCGHSRIPVYRANRDDILGILYVKDILGALGAQGWGERPVGDLVRKAYFVPETKKASELFQEFRSERFHIAIVLDEYGGTSGLVTIEDLVEEIVGEIEDEFENRPSRVHVRRVAEGVYDVEGNIHIDELNDLLGIETPDDDGYETLAGFLFSRWGRVPAIGERTELRDADFEIMDADERRIKLVRVRVHRGRA